MEPKFSINLEKNKPFGSGKRAFIVEDHPNGEKHFKIGFLNGLKMGIHYFLAGQWIKTFNRSL